MKITRCVLLMAGLAVVARPVMAQDPEPELHALPRTVIEGTRIATLPENTSSPVTVIRREEADERQLYFLADALRGEPGLDVLSSGQPGALTTVLLRGGSSAQTLVLVDGVRVNSPFNNAFDFANSTLNNVEQIEVLRGPQSTLYGSEALGGVINIVTRKEGDRIAGSGRVEYGSFDTWLGRGAFTVAEQGLTLSAEGGAFQSDNDRINSDTATRSLSGRAGYRISDQFAVSFLGTYDHGDAGSPNDRFTDDPNDRLRTENTLFALTLDSDPTSWWNAKLVGSYGRERATFDQPQPNPPWSLPDYESLTVGRRQAVDFQNILTPADHHKILAGITYRHDEAEFGDTYGGFEDHIDNVAGYAQYEFAPIERVTATAGGRVDDFSSFGTHATYRVGLRGTVPGTETILRANVGSGFRAPSIRELYWPIYGNPDLQPEESLGWDIGAEQPLLKDTMRLGVTFFHNDYDNLINGFPPRNVDSARALGIENFLRWRPYTNLTARAAYTWLDATDRSDGSQLERRPKHRGSVDVNYEFLKGLSANAYVLVVGERPDADFSAFPPAGVVLPVYVRFDLGLSWKACKHFTVYGRVQNLTNESYEEVYGFPALGRTFTIGGMASF